MPASAISIPRRSMASVSRRNPAQPFPARQAAPIYVISTKVGRLLDVCTPEERTGIGKFFDTPSRREIYDYSL